MKVIEPNQKRFALVVASVLCVAIFSVIVGQALWSDIITFEKNGDNLKQCFPSMLKVVEYLKSGVLWGVDTGTFNGATEFFLIDLICLICISLWFFLGFYQVIYQID